MEKYVVTRVSAGYDEKPCDEAVSERNVHHQWDEWVVELDGIHGLQEFMKKHGQIIMHNGCETRYPNITIYDDYCE